MASRILVLKSGSPSNRETALLNDHLPKSCPNLTQTISLLHKREVNCEFNWAELIQFLQGLDGHARPSPL